MTNKVIIPKISDDLTDHYLAKHGYEVVTVENPGEDEIMATAPDAAAVMMISKNFPNDLYAKMPNLKVLARRGVGYDNIDVDYAAEQGVWVTNTPGANAHSVAEMALMHMLMLARRFPQVNRRLRENDWEGGAEFLGNDLSSATVGVIGFGNIGQEIARIVSGLGARVLIYARHPRDTEYGTFVDWETLFQEADFVSLSIAATPETQHMVGANEFEMMKNSAALVNVARGSIVDEPALIRALETNGIAGAGLDVFENEPLEADSKLRQLDNVVMTPHVAANTLDANREMSITAVRMIDEVLQGRTPEFGVNKPKF